MYNQIHHNEIIRVLMASTAIAFRLFVTLLSRLILFQILAVLSISSNLQALLIALQALVRPKIVAAGPATFAFVRHVAFGIGVVVGHVIFQSVMGRHGAALVDDGIPADMAESFVSGQVVAAHEMFKRLSEGQQELVRGAVAEGVSKLRTFLWVASGVGSVATFFVRRVELSGMHTETKTGLEAAEAMVIEDRMGKEWERGGEV